MRKLHLGCGNVIRKGWVNLDIAKLTGVDVVWDLERAPYPFRDNEFSEVEAHHVLEHIGNLVGMMEELHRICADGAVIRVSMPYFSSTAYWLDPTHKRMFNIDSFRYFAPGSYYSTARVSVVRRRIFYMSCRSFMRSRWYSWPVDALINMCQPCYQRFFAYILPASEIHFELRVEKGGGLRRRSPRARRASPRQAASRPRPRRSTPSA